VPSLSGYKSVLEALYARYHCLFYRAMDPVEVVWGYEGVEDQAIAGLWAALFAWGQRRVAIQKTRALLQALVPSPYAYLQSGRPLHILLRHRTWNPETIALMWEGLREIYGRYGGLEAFFRPYREGLWEGVAAFQAEMVRGAPALRRYVGDLWRGSASKRLWLWLRWMIRQDEIDPGPWAATFSPAELYVPLDVHLFSWARRLGLLHTSTANWRAVVALTELFRELVPHDPLRYDFAILTASALGELQKVTWPS
jgi:uncharacterized protein (TIGR02757 family)